MALRRAGTGAAVLIAAAVAAAVAAAALSAPEPADAASHLAGMRLDGLAAGGHAVTLEFAAQPEDGAGGGPVQPGTLALVEGLVRTESGPLALGGDGARVMVTGGGTIVVHSTDDPAVLFAVPVWTGDGDPGRYKVTAHVPRSGNGGFEVATFEATLGPSGGDADGKGEDAAPAPAAALPGEAGGDADAGGKFPDDIAVAVTITERVQFGGALIVQGRVYDAALNDRPVVVPRGPGAVPDVPVQVTVTDKRTGEAILVQDGEADESGLFRAEYRWRSSDPAATLGIVISVDGGRAVEERTAFYLGDAGNRGSRSD